MMRFPILTTILLLSLISGLPACQSVQPVPQDAEFYTKSGWDDINKDDLDSAISNFNKAIDLNGSLAN
jgi:hypothetical protein